MRLELKALIAAVIAGVVVVAGAYGVSAIVVHMQPGRSQGASVQNQQSTSAGAGSQAISPQFVAQGSALFAQSCSSCHGTNGTGGFGPNLHHEDLSDAQITQKIKNGVSGKMPPFSSKYNDAQVQTLVVYIRSLK